MKPRDPSAPPPPAYPHGDGHLEEARDKLIASLRETHPRTPDGSTPMFPAIPPDSIERFIRERDHEREENQRLRAENARLREDLATILAERDGFCMIAGNATAEVARLRELLGEIAADGYGTPIGLYERIRTALATNTTQPATGEPGKEE